MFHLRSLSLSLFLSLFLSVCVSLSLSLYLSRCLSLLSFLSFFSLFHWPEPTVFVVVVVVVVVVLIRWGRIDFHINVPHPIIALLLFCESKAVGRRWRSTKADYTKAYGQRERERESSFCGVPLVLGRPIGFRSGSGRRTRRTLALLGRPIHSRPRSLPKRNKTTKFLPTLSFSSARASVVVSKNNPPKKKQPSCHPVKLGKTQ